MSVHEDIRQASTLPSAFYKDPAIYRDVIERVFARSWQFAGDLEAVKVPGAVWPFILLEGALDEPVVVTRDTDDQIHVLSNVCTHRGMQVVEGMGNERFLRCRYHGRRFGLDGCFQHMPEFAGVAGFPSAKDNLPKVPHGLLSNFLFVSVDPSHSFEETIRPVVDRVGWLPLDDFRYEPSRAREYMVRANWALYVDNYLEGFHIPFIHAGLNEALDYGNYTTEHFSRGNLQLAVSKGGENVFDLPRSSPDYGKEISAYYFWLFPNTMLNFYPWGLSVNVVRPLAPDLMKVSFIPYVWDESKLDRGAGSSLDRVEREDEAVVELVQRGVRSRFYDRGRYSPAREDNVWQFHRLLSAALG
ncbi:MAG: aromatic ring-hydroxylating dioxygenase subunit alpha [Fimbriimonas sp.]